MDENTTIFLIILCSFILMIIICSCGKFYRDSQRQLQSRINIKNLYNKLAYRRLIKPVTFIQKTNHIYPNNDDEYKDEKENIIRRGQIININKEDNV